MSIPFEEEYGAVLQNIESAIVSVYREDPEISDWTVETAIDALVRTYQAEERGRTAPRLRLSAQEKLIVERVTANCEWRLGRGEVKAGAEETAALAKDEELYSLQEIIACLKRIQNSVKLWHKQGGRRGYLDYVSRFIL